jgi:chemotaxis protein histidine kinase CheA
MAKPKLDPVDIQTFADHHVITPGNPLRRALRRVPDSDRDDPVARAEQALADLSGEFAAWMAVECERLAAAHADVLARGFTPETRDELFRAAHDIKGDAATFGFPTAAAAADSLCRIIEHAPDLDRVPAELFSNHIMAIQAIVREHSKAGAEELERALGQRLRTVADDYLTAVNRDRPEHLDAILAPGLAPE